MPTNNDDRTAGIGGSDAAAALGLSPWKTQYQLWREKVGLDTPPDIDNKPHIEWGKLLEDVIADKFADVANLTVQRINGTLCNANWPWMFAHIDRAVVNPAIAGRVVWNGKRLSTDAILEAKTASRYTADDWGEEGTDQIPLHYAAQAVHYLAVTGVAICHFGVLIDGRTFKRYIIERDVDLMERVIEGEREFWQMVIDRREPEVTTIADARRKYARSNERTIEANDDMRNKVALLAATRSREKTAGLEAEELELEIMQYMGDAAVLTVRGLQAVTWRTAKPSRVFDRDTFIDLHPDLWEKFQIMRPGSRRFLIK